MITHPSLVSLTSTFFNARDSRSHIPTIPVRSRAFRRPSGILFPPGPLVFLGFRFESPFHEYSGAGTTQRAAPGIEPRTSRTLSENHTTRPNSQMLAARNCERAQVHEGDCSDQASKQAGGVVFSTRRVPFPAERARRLLTQASALVLGRLNS